MTFYSYLRSLLLPCLKTSVLSFVLFSTVSFTALAQQQNNLLDEETPKEAKPFILLDLLGKVHSLSDYKNKVLIVNFWASWCGPCREEIPAMNRAWAQLKDKNIAMLAVNFGEDSNTVTSFIKKYPIDFTVLLDETNTISHDWNITLMPTTVIINEQGVIIDTIVGPRKWDSPEMIETLLRLKM